VGKLSLSAQMDIMIWHFALARRNLQQWRLPKPRLPRAAQDGATIPTPIRCSRPCRVPEVEQRPAVALPKAPTGWRDYLEHE
jgi:hypothetical protein